MSNLELKIKHIYTKGRGSNDSSYIRQPYLNEPVDFGNESNIQLFINLYTILGKKKLIDPDDKERNEIITSRAGSGYFILAENSNHVGYIPLPLEKLEPKIEEFVTGLENLLRNFGIEFHDFGLIDPRFTLKYQEGVEGYRAGFFMESFDREQSSDYSDGYKLGLFVRVLVDTGHLLHWQAINLGKELYRECAENLISGLQGRALSRSRMLTKEFQAGYQIRLNARGLHFIDAARMASDPDILNAFEEQIKNEPTIYNPKIEVLMDPFNTENLKGVFPIAEKSTHLPERYGRFETPIRYLSQGVNSFTDFITKPARRLAQKLLYQ